MEALLDLCCVTLANLDSNAHLFQMLDAARSSSYCSSARPLQSGKAKGNPVKWGDSAQKYSSDKYQSKSVKAQMGLAWFLAHHKILCRSRLMFEIFNPTQMGKFFSLSIVRSCGASSPTRTPRQSGGSISAQSSETFGAYLGQWILSVHLPTAGLNCTIEARPVASQSGSPWPALPRWRTSP